MTSGPKPGVSPERETDYNLRMAIVETTQELPLTTTADGTIKISGSRVSLDSIIFNYRQGATAEEIAMRFPGVRLADIHSCIAYFLNHHEEVDKYLADRERSAADLREQIISDPLQQQGLNDMRERINARRADLNKTS
jgi:uncharacterized protein (DUF433 family)